MSGIHDQNISLKILSTVDLLQCNLCSLVCMGKTTRGQVNISILLIFTFRKKNSPSIRKITRV